MSGTFEQLTLSILKKPRFALEEFYFSSANQAIQAEIARILSGQGDQVGYLYFYGGQGVGKSHLLQGLVQSFSALKKTAIYLPMKTLLKYEPSALDNLARYQLLALDDVQCVAGHGVWEEALFHLFNQVQESRHVLVIAGEFPVKQLGVKLPDLESRLLSNLHLKLSPLSSEEMAALLKKHAYDQGLMLSEEVLAYIFSRYPRDLGSLMQLLDRLSHLSLVQKKKITVKLVKDLGQD